MKRTLLIVLGLLVLLVAAAALVIPALVDVERHRPAIREALESATGRQVDLGTLSLSILPRPTLEASGLSIGEDPSFGERPFLEAEGMRVSVSLLPLLGGTVAVDSLEITRPSLRLIRDGERRWNVASLAGDGEGETGSAGEGPGREGEGREGSKAGGRPDREKEEGTASGVSLSVARLSLRNGTVSVEDRSLEPGKLRTTEASGIDLSVTDLSLTTPVGFDLRFSLDGAEEIHLSGTAGPAPSGEGRIWPVRGRLRVEDLAAGPAFAYLGEFTGLTIRKGSLDLDLDLEVDPSGDSRMEGEADLRKIRLAPLAAGGRPASFSGSVALKAAITSEGIRLERGDLSTGESALSITGSIDDPGGRPVVDARVRSDRIAFEDLKPVLALLGPILPGGLGGEGTASMDATIRGSLVDPGSIRMEGEASIDGFEYSDPALREPIREIRGALTLEGDRVSISGFQATLGKSVLSGTCTLGGFDPPTLEVQITSPNLDMDEILSLMATGQEDQREARDPAAPGPDRSRQILLVRQGAPAGGRRGRPLLAEGSILRELTLRGTLDLAAMKLLNLSLSSVKASLSMTGGNAILDQVRLGLYGGSLQGRASLGLAEAGPPFTLAANLEGVDFAALMKDYSPETAGVAEGTLHAALDLRGRGLRKRALKRSLAGTGEIELREGRLTTLGLNKKVAHALEEQEEGSGEKEETPFKVLGGSFAFVNGRARTQDLRLISPDIKLRGKGQVEMDLDLDLEVSVRFSPQASEDLIARTPDLKYFRNDKGRLAADFDVGGSLMKPSARIQKDSVRRAAAKAARDGRFGLFKRILDRRKERRKRGS